MQRLVRFGYIVISTACKSFVCNGVGQYPTSCNSPIAFTGISVSVCLPVGHYQLLQVLHPCSRLLPLLPDIHSYSSAKPLVPPFHIVLHLRYSVISKPSSHKHLYLVKHGMQFLFVRSRFCLRLLSDSASRRTPLSLTNSSYCHACSGLSPPSYYACRTHKKSDPMCGMVSLFPPNHVSSARVVPQRCPILRYG